MPSLQYLVTTHPSTNGTDSFDFEWDMTTDNTSNSNHTVFEDTVTLLPWWQQLFYSIAALGIIAVSAGGNIIVMWIVLAHKRMRTVTNYFVVNLALADTMITIFNTMFSSVYLVYQNWWFGENFCKFFLFVLPFTISASVFTFMAIAVDRYLAIIRWVRMSEKVVAGIIALIWIASMLIALPVLVYARTHTFFFTNGDQRTYCFTHWPDGMYGNIDFIYNVFLLIVNYFLPMLILIITYTILGMELWGSKAIGVNTSIQQQRVKAKRKVVKMMIVVVVIFAVCWLPMHTYFIVQNHHKDIIDYAYIQQIFLVVYLVAMSNSMYNPIIYCWMNARFRQGFKMIFRCCPCIHLQARRPKVRGFTVSMRTSMSESDTKYERNGSVMHTMVEHFDNSCSTPVPSGKGSRALTTIKDDYEREENYL